MTLSEFIKSIQEFKAQHGATPTRVYLNSDLRYQLIGQARNVTFANADSPHETILGLETFVDESLSEPRFE